MSKLNPLLIYYVLTFSISWGVVYVTVGPNGFPASPKTAETSLPIVVAATLLGPSVSGIVLTCFLYGASGLKILFRLFYIKWKVWYVLIPLVTPLTVALILTILSFAVSSEWFTPALFREDDKATLVSIGFGYGIAAGMFEELGWSGFLVRQMQRTHSDSFFVGMSVGLIWGIWHFLVALWGSGGEDGKFSMDLFLPWIPWNLLVLPAYRVLMVHIFDQTGCMLLMLLMHASLTASLPLILMPSVIGLPLAAFYCVFAFAITAIDSTFLFMTSPRQKIATADRAKQS